MVVAQLTRLPQIPGVVKVHAAGTLHERLQYQGRDVISPQYFREIFNFTVSLKSDLTAKFKKWL